MQGTIYPRFLPHRSFENTNTCLDIFIRCAILMAVRADYSRNLIGGTSVPSPAPNQSWPRVSRSAWRKDCTATLTHSYKLSAS
jgi:hypothetical protein